MSQQKDQISESTVARIAGNIAAGFASKPDFRMSEYGDAEGVAQWGRSVVLLSVGIARAIAAEVERTKPRAASPVAGEQSSNETPPK